MYQGDKCITYGNSGSVRTYAEVVHNHYRDYRILFWVAVALTLIFIAHAIREFIRSRRTRIGR